MTTSVADKTSIPVASGRKHTDPPFLWFVVTLSSISLHLLVFWWLNSSSTGTEFWFPQSNQSAEIPVDFVEIAPSTKPVEKPPSQVAQVIPKTTEQESSVSAVVKQPKPTPSNRQTEIIKSEQQRPQPQVTRNQVQRQRQPFKSQVTPAPQSTLTPQPQPSIVTPPTGELPWGRRQEIKLGRGTQLPNDIPGESPAPTQEETPTATPTPTGEVSPPPLAEATPEPTQTATYGGAIATVSSILKNEVTQLIKQRILLDEALPDVLPQYQGSSNKQIDPSFLPSGGGLEPANILASLIIDQNGNFQQSVVLDITPAKLRTEKSIYEQALNEVFKQEKFIAAYNNNGSQPVLSNLYVRIKIQPINSQ
ncbi:hypothetical protein B6N60_00796 [Richelia sinica FACHB-800]|uniref:Uncharacterized protein n=1 Tax=Richelia sinica FACHB-800 TaxID=1357546 RepID=A0A975T554_9NOST|nr:hypothetical protein [Richelia sinica]MBD2664473.1 hypothetical protein [Richelia sinica FACHB-800]QXE22115.1 hypothetical protein B6N60_00796 [Richelia sinica FACHB-800]